MGGLLTKYILTNDENEELRSNTRACVFFSVPHFGAELGLFYIQEKQKKVLFFHLIFSIIWYSSCIFCSTNC